MSSPTSRSPIGPSDWAPRATWKRADMEQHSAEAAKDPLRSPYTLKRPHEYAGGERHPSANDLLGPSHAWGQMPNHAGMTPGAVDTTTAENPSGDEKSVVDLERLEQSLRGLLRQEIAIRLPRVAPLPLVRGLTPPDTPRYSRADASIRPKSLEPELMPPPPAAPRRRYLGASLGFLVVSIAAGAIGFYAARAGWWSPANHVAAPSAPKIVASVALVGPRERDPTVSREDDPDALRASEASDRARAITQLTKLSERSAMAMVPEGELEAQIPAGSKAPRALDSDGIKLLITQGEQFAAAGDLVSARIVLQRAAQAGDASAAMALGATYDPIVLAKIGVVGLSADVEQARSWYQKAESLGSSEATRRLQILAR